MKENELTPIKLHLFFAAGMMDAAYFIGRKELLDFFNDLLELNLQKIEETASGAVACQITELIFPQSIPMSKVNWEARSDYEFVQNYKLLQNAFTKHHIQRYVDVNKLIRAKYQDNLEFCQWLKAFYDQSGTFREEYDPTAVRARGKGGKRYNQTKGRKGGLSSASRPKPTSRSAPTKPSQPLRSVANKPNTSSSSAPPSSSATKTPEPIVDPALVEENEKLRATNTELEASVATLEEAVLETEQERQFYFEKLRDVEVLLQVYQENPSTGTDNLIEKVFKVLYAVRCLDVSCSDRWTILTHEYVSRQTAEDKVTVTDDGEILAGEQTEEAATATVAEETPDEF